MNKQTFTNWGGAYDPNASSAQSAVSLGPEPFFRDAKDRRLQAFGATPDTQYPDGYLGKITDRRENRLEATRSNLRSYTRGVHKGERVNPGDYIWPTEFNPETALQYEARGLKFAPTGAAPVVLVNDGKTAPIGRPDMEVINQQRRSMLKTLIPQWR